MSSNQYALNTLGNNRNKKLYTALNKTNDMQTNKII